MISVDEALRLLLGEARVLEPAELPLDRAAGCALAEDVRADRDLPPTDRSAMDGFAVRSEDADAAGRTLRVAGEIRAGEPVGAVRVDPGTCVRIMTGAIVPPGADSVVMVELTEEDRKAGTVTFRERAFPGLHVRRRGEDVRAGDPILSRGTPVHAAEIAALASVGRTTVRVHRPPRVCVLSTGDEIVPPDEAPADHQVRNSNAWTLRAQLREMGLEARDLGIAPDRREALAGAFDRGLEADVLLVTGGVSMGEYDLVGELLRRSGMRVVFHRVAVRPGKPILVGRRGRCLVVGLPGNPVSAYTGFAVFVAPALRKMMGYACTANAEVEAVLDDRLRRKPGRTTYHLARVQWRDGAFRARTVRTMGSGDVVSLARANGFVVTPGGAHALEAGTSVPALLWRDFQAR